MQEEEEESKEPIEQEEEMSFFQWNVNEAMAKKALIPSLTVLISVENDRSEMDFFWRNSAVLHAMNSSFIVVRLGKNENALEISQFSQIFVIKSYPSLYVFGPFSHGISYAWTDGFPSVEEFVNFFNGSHDYNDTANDFSELIRTQQQNLPPPPPQNNMNQMNQPQGYNNQMFNQPQNFNTPNYNAFNQHPSNIYNQQNASLDVDIPFHDNANVEINKEEKLPKRPFKHQNPPKPPSRKTARISARSQTRTIVKEFPPDKTIGDVIDWLEYEFGPGYEYYVAHLNRNLTNDRSRTLAREDLVPSALIQLRGYGDPDFRPPPPPVPSNFETNDNQTAPTLEIDESLPSLGHTNTPEVIPRNDEEDPSLPQRESRFKTIVKKILSVVNPWGDIEEIEDFFEVKEFRR